MFNYLSVKPNKILDDIPENPDKDEWIDFFKKHKFTQLPSKDLYTQISESLEESEKPAYILGNYAQMRKYTWYIAFSKGGKITKLNPLFLLRTHKDIHDDDKYVMWTGSIVFGHIDDDKVYLNNYEEFTNEVKKAIH